MCISPSTLADGTEAACHRCWQCREQAVDDWVGRNIAESRTSVASHAATLTYGRSRAGDVDHVRAAILTYSDVQKCLKLLRYHGYAVRYFAIGEYGARKGRAHWHVIFHWVDRVPDMVLDRNFMWSVRGRDGDMHLVWPHGFAMLTKPTHAAFRYNCKYILKDQGPGEDRQGHLAMSKKPPLGSAYFARMAERYAEQGLAPQDLHYVFPEVTAPSKELRGSRERKRFMLRDRSAELFLDAYGDAWARLQPGRRIPPSDLVNNWLEWRALSVPDDPARYAAFVERHSTRPIILPPGDGPPRVAYSFMSSRRVRWSYERGQWEHPSQGDGRVWRFIDGRWKHVKGVFRG